MNNLDPEVAERPDDLVVYGGTGRAARSWAAFDAIVATLKDLEDDETLLVQSGKPVGVFRTHEWAPRVLIANSNLVGDWATWPHFRKLEAEGLMMYGQMTAGSWIYIGTQGILQGTFETFAAVAGKLAVRRGEPAEGATLAGTLTVTAGCGGMGGAQPLAVTLNGGACLVIDVDRRPASSAAPASATSTSSPTTSTTPSSPSSPPRPSVAPSRSASSATRPSSSPSSSSGTSPSTSSPTRPARTTRCPTCPTASTSATGTTTRTRSRRSSPTARAQSMAKHVEAMVGFMDKGAEVFDYGNSIRDEARSGGYERAFDFPGFVPAYIRPLFCEGLGPFRWVALSGDPEDIARHRRGAQGALPRQRAPAPLARRGAPSTSSSRGCRPGSAGSATASAPRPGCSSTGSSPRARSRRRSSSAATTSTPARSPRPTARPRRWRTARTPSPTGRCSTPWSTPASGATWVSIHHGGGVGIGRSIHAGQVSVADGTALAAAEARAAADQRPRHGRHPARRRGLRPRRRGRPRARRAHPHGALLTDR